MVYNTPYGGLFYEFGTNKKNGTRRYSNGQD